MLFRLRTFSLLTTLALLLLIAGCGKKGPPQAPTDTPDTYPGQYPKAIEDMNGNYTRD